MPMPTRTLRLRIRAGVANRASSWCPSTGTTTDCPMTSGTNWPGANTINRKPGTASKSLIPVQQRTRCPRRTTTAPSQTRLTSFGKPETAKRAISRKTLTTTKTTTLRGLPKTGCSSAGRVWPTTPWTKAAEKALTSSFTPTTGATWTTTLTAKRTKSVSTSVGRWTAWGIPSTCPVWTSSAYIPVSTSNAVGWGRLPPN